MSRTPRTALRAMLLVLTLVLLGSVWTTPAAAQRRYRPPYGSPLSPYLDYFRRDTGALGDTYNAWVRPRMNLQNEIYQQRQTLYNLRSGLRDVGRDVEQLERLERGELLRESGAAPTGTGSRFMNYSHFYRLPVRPR